MTAMGAKPEAGISKTGFRSAPQADQGARRDPGNNSCADSGPPRDRLVPEFRSRVTASYRLSTTEKVLAAWQKPQMPLK
jgi:hypothetical protein